MTSWSVVIHEMLWLMSPLRGFRIVAVHWQFMFKVLYYWLPNFQNGTEQSFNEQSFVIFFVGGNLSANGTDGAVFFPAASQMVGSSEDPWGGAGGMGS